MWDTVAWNYRLHRRPPEFTFKKVNVVVRDGVVHVNNGGEVTEILSGDDSIGGVRVIVSRQKSIMLFIIGRTRRGKLSSYTAGVSCHDQLVTTDIMQVAIDWTRKKATLTPSDGVQAAIDNVRTDDAIQRPQSIGVSFERITSERISQERPVFPGPPPVYNARIDQPNDSVPAPWSEAFRSSGANVVTTVSDGSLSEVSEEVRRDETSEGVIRDVYSI